MKVLIIDDDDDVRCVAEMSLGLIGGMVVISASGGPEGFDLALSEHPDFILLDLMMPIIDGAATLESLQADERTSSIPVVFLTARGQDAETARLLRLGARGVLHKPFDPLTLASEITAILTQ